MTRNDLLGLAGGVGEATLLEALGLAGTGTSGGGTAGSLLLSHLLGLLTLGTLRVDVINKNALVLEDVTLSLQVKLLVEVVVDLAIVTVVGEKAAKDTGTADPENLGGHTGLAGTGALAETTVAAFSLSLGTGTDTEAGNTVDLLLGDNVITNKLTDTLTAGGLANFVHLSGVDPDTALTALENVRSKALLKLKLNLG